MYRVRLEDPDSKTRKFKLLLYVDLPDRLHGEIVSPVGTTVLVFDGGSGRLAVTYVRDRTSFVGPSSADAVESLFGVHASLEGLVRALWTGDTSGEEFHVERAGPKAGIPTRFEIVSNRRRMILELRKYQTLRGAGDSVGTGEPPHGTTILPLDDLARFQVALDEAEQ